MVKCMKVLFVLVSLLVVVGCASVISTNGDSLKASHEVAATF